MNTIYVDVREKNEFAEKHIPGALNTPLSSLEEYLQVIVELANKNKVTLVCQSGMRAEQAKEKLKKVNAEFNADILQGGMNNWKENGENSSTKSTLPIIRQVMIIAGLLILAGALPAYFININFIWLSAFVGLGLFFAGASGICLMAKILQFMPWNK
jgi:rhodanese-related sulfurtransferase